MGILACLVVSHLVWARSADRAESDDVRAMIRDGDIVIPKLNLQEPLKVQADAFIRRLTTGEPTVSEGDAGLHKRPDG